ncbi:hypothetical protein F8M41_018836 [Gigaspora margarita]|uniref:Uncharacterized protein n=2 Tax=Gigaspora margarita TaxID=4874 RepID=A0A8H3ZYA7_GIGMA|nr:hypothetical protein F8M41_018836 [Gigaspora margarita]
MLRKPFTRINNVLTSNGYFNHYEPEETFDLTVNEEHSPDDNALENFSDSTDHQLRHLPSHVDIYCGKTFETWEECQEALDRYGAKIIL